jgi:hypothetical protein
VSDTCRTALTGRTADDHHRTSRLPHPDASRRDQRQSLEPHADDGHPGHYPWCNDHEGEPFTLDGYCRRIEKGRVAEIVLSKGSLAGAPLIGIHENDGVDFEELSVDQAALLGSQLEIAARLGMEFNVEGDPR